MAIWCVVFLTVIIGVMANNVTLEDVTTTAESRMLEQIERLSQTLSDIKGINDRVDEMKRDLNNISLILSEMNKSSKDKPMEHTNLGCEYISSCMGESLAQMQNETNAMFDTTNRVLGTISDSLQNFSTSNAQRMSNHEQMIERVPQETGYLQLDTCNNINFEVSRDWSDNHGYGGNWIVFQRRFNGSVIFYRNWAEYKQGFGNVHGEHWLGLDKLHTIVKTRQHELLIELKDFRGVIAYAHYDDFKIGDESEKYVIKSVGRYTGTAGDSFSAHKDEVFSTYDQDNDRYSESCATRFLGAWWFNKCFNSHLNGMYLTARRTINLESDNNEQGIIWQRFRGMQYSLKRTKMMVRPRINDLSRTMDKKIQVLNDRVDELLAQLSKQLQSITTSTTQRIINLEQKLAQLPQDTGVYLMQPDTSKNVTFEVSRDWSNNHGFGDNWIVFQRRFNGSVNFFRNWTEYKQGFGDLHGEHWLGLDNLHAILKPRQHELLIVLEDFDGVIAYAHYDDFKIGDESEKYVLKSVGSYSGTAGDSLFYQKFQKFSTYDQDNDMAPFHCANGFVGAWWFFECYYSHLNGRYWNAENNRQPGIIWRTFRGLTYSLKSSKMMRISNLSRTMDKKIRVLNDRVVELLGSISEQLQKFSTSSAQRLTNLEQKIALLPQGTGVYLLQPDTTKNVTFEVSRDWSNNHGFGDNWIVFQRRFNGSVNFYRNWTEYKQGFGDLHGEHWLGLDKLHAIVKTRQHELLIELKDFRGVI
uniref:Fibrinogen C-terminal domain-containing protein n=1 Tax=Anopheles minimus TaxID=112268 RepID=A0A182W261_9DIPT